jgi:hypothetical protein
LALKIKYVIIWLYLTLCDIATYTRDNRFKVSNFSDLGTNYIKVEEFLDKLPQTINVCVIGFDTYLF